MKLESGSHSCREVTIRGWLLIELWYHSHHNSQSNVFSIKINTQFFASFIERAKRAHSLFMSIEISDIYI